MNETSQYQTSKKVLLPTTPDIEGPFYKNGSPLLIDNNMVSMPALFLSGRVTDTDGNAVLGNPNKDEINSTPVLDFWQADEQGNYDMDGFKLRGKVKADTDGKYSLGTVKPGFYKISDPGQPDEFRCAHIHVKLWLDGKLLLTTQLYFPDDPYDDTDHWFNKSRCVSWGDGGPASGSCTFNFVLSH